MDIISLLVTVVGVIVVVFSSTYLIKKRIKFLAFLMWTVIGTFLLVVGMFPFEISSLLLSIGVIEPFNAFVILGFLGLTLLFLLMYRRILQLEEKFIRFIQKEALRHFKENNKEEKKNESNVCKSPQMQ